MADSLEVSYGVLPDKAEELAGRAEDTLAVWGAIDGRLRLEAISKMIALLLPLHGLALDVEPEESGGEEQEGDPIAQLYKGRHRLGELLAALFEIYTGLTDAT
jgi:hypothetical protein